MERESESEKSQGYQLHISYGSTLLHFSITYVLCLLQKRYMEQNTAGTVSLLRIRIRISSPNYLVLVPLNPISNNSNYYGQGSGQGPMLNNLTLVLSYLTSNIYISAYSIEQTPLPSFLVKSEVRRPLELQSRDSRSILGSIPLPGLRIHILAEFWSNSLRFW